MAELINLRRIRKRLARDADAQAAAASRAKHGQTRHERGVAKAEADSASRTLDGARITPLSRDGEDPE